MSNLYPIKDITKADLDKLQFVVKEYVEAILNLNKAKSKEAIDNKEVTEGQTALMKKQKALSDFTNEQFTPYPGIPDISAWIDDFNEDFEKGIAPEKMQENANDFEEEIEQFANTAVASLPPKPEEPKPNVVEPPAMKAPVMEAPKPYIPDRVEAEAPEPKAESPGILERIKSFFRGIRDYLVSLAEPKQNEKGMLEAEQEQAQAMESFKEPEPAVSKNSIKNEGHVVSPDQPPKVSMREKLDKIERDVKNQADSGNSNPSPRSSSLAAFDADRAADLEDIFGMGITKGRASKERASDAEPESQANVNPEDKARERGPSGPGMRRGSS